MTIGSTIQLANGVEMPLFGLGVFLANEGTEVEQAVRWALEAGYRSIDTAAIYRNEVGVGKALRASGVPRSEVFVTSKVWNSEQGYDSTLRAFDASLSRLEMDYLDLYLVHWPVKEKYHDTWKALETIYEQGQCRAIGVSNFLPHHLEDLLPAATIKPMVNQVEFHPRLQQPALQALCKQHGIVLEAWRPIMKGAVADIPEIAEIASRRGKNAVQVTLRWMIQKGIVAIPKSVRQERIISNADLYDFVLTDQDMQVMDALDQGLRIGADPDNFDF